MPGGLSGQELARRLQRENSALRVVCTSGYSAELASKALELRSGENFLEKPFPPNRLLDIVRRSLDEGTPHR
jgi:FixJ family two-component response regulator